MVLFPTFCENVHLLQYIIYYVTTRLIFSLFHVILSIQMIGLKNTSPDGLLLLYFQNITSPSAYNISVPLFHGFANVCYFCFHIFPFCCIQKTILEQKMLADSRQKRKSGTEDNPLCRCQAMVIRTASGPQCTCVLR